MIKTLLKRDAGLVATARAINLEEYELIYCLLVQLLDC
jgi:hypothetical protein